MSNNKFIFNKLVVGSDLEAILCSFYNKFPIIHTRSLKPDDNDTIEDYGLGTSKKQIWEQHVLQLSIAGYMPFQDNILHIVYVDQNTLKIVTKQENIYIVKFEELYVFDDYNILDLPVDLQRASEEIRMIDTFNVVDDNLDDIESIQNKNKFMNQIIIDNDKVTVISYLKKNDIEKYEPFLVKIKCEGLIAHSKKVELLHVSREIYDLEKNLYEDFDNVTFSYADSKTIHELRKKRAKIDYMKYFRMKIGLSHD